MLRSPDNQGVLQPAGKIVEDDRGSWSKVFRVKCTGSHIKPLPYHDRHGPVDDVNPAFTHD